MATQQTLAGEVTAKGVGLHLGQQTTVRLMPAEPNDGRYFVRMDLAGSPTGSTAGSERIAATVTNVIKTQLSTELGVGEAQVRTVEHLLSALVALDVGQRAH